MAVVDHLLPVTGLPEGVNAKRVRHLRTTDSGDRVEVLVNRRLRRTDDVDLVATVDYPVELDIGEAEERWLLGAGRRQWRSIEAHYGDEAWARSLELVQAGIVCLRCRVSERMSLGEPRSWTLTAEWDARRRRRGDEHEHKRAYWRQRADAAAARVEERSSELAAALRTAPSMSPITPVLVFAAEDLCDGVAHAGPRAFSQAHFRDTKARDDVAQILARVSVPDAILIALGLRRSARIGVAGPVRAIVAGEHVNIGLLHGPVILRVDQTELQLRAHTAPALVIVENLQAAETLADQMPELAIAYSGGFPSNRALTLLAELAQGPERVLLVPDADLGGVRIAERILDAVPQAELIDIGEMEHPPRKPWASGGDTERGLQAALDGPASALARGCLSRRYPVEQELATIDAVRRALSTCVDSVHAIDGPLRTRRVPVARPEASSGVARA